MTALDYILSHYLLPKYDKSPKERAVLKALVHTLQPNELKTLQKKLKRSPSKLHVGTDLYNEAVKVENNIVPQRNESISSLLKQFTDKNSGMVETARKKLRDRYEKQDFRTQRKILNSMLHASKLDRTWAYYRLQSNWDDFFYEDIKSLWELYHEKECGVIVIKNFPSEYVYNNLNALDVQGNYTSLCIKLIHHPQFQIDLDRLKECAVFNGSPKVEYLYILAKSKSNIEKGVATNTLFEQMSIYINTHDAPPYYAGNYKFDQQIRERSITTKHFDFVSGIVWCMGELGLIAELIAFEKWDSKVKDSFFNSIDFDLVEHESFANSEKYLWDLYRQTIVESMPCEYQKLINSSFSTLLADKFQKDMLQQNPAISTLIDQFDLELQGEP